MVKFPEIINLLAAAGDRGIEVPQNADSWNPVELAKKMGLRIDLSGNRAYLVPDPDPLIPAWIEKETAPTAWNEIRCVGFLEVDSTNSEALRRISDGAPQGTIIISNHQAAGRGRQNRRWHSPPGAGLYFSVILRPRQPLLRWPLLTHAAGVALVRTLRQLEASELQGRSLLIDLKWPNDLLLAGKKAAGVLLESAQVGSTCVAAVLGIGVNMSAECVPDELKQDATALECEAGRHIPRRRLLVQLLDQLQEVYLHFERGEAEWILNEWKAASSMWNGVPIWIEEGNRRREATTCGITDQGALMIRTREGASETVLAGDVRIRRSQ